MSNLSKVIKIKLHRVQKLGGEETQSTVEQYPIIKSKIKMVQRKWVKREEVRTRLVVTDGKLVDNSIKQSSEWHNSTSGTCGNINDQRLHQNILQMAKSDKTKQ